MLLLREEHGYRRGMCLMQPIKYPPKECRTSKKHTGDGKIPLVCLDTACPHPHLCQVLFSGSEQRESCPQQEGLGSLGRPASRSPEDPQLQKAVSVRKTWVFKWLEEGVGSTEKICSGCEGEADGDALDHSYLQG